VDGVGPREELSSPAAANLLVTATELDAGSVTVTGDAYRHLFRARRLDRAARLRLVDGGGRARWAEIDEIDGRRALLRVLGEAPANDPARCVELYVATPRPERAAWLVEKATELGVAAVRFVGSERGVRGVDRASLARLVRVAGAALEQCGGARLPELSGPHALDELRGLLTSTLAYVLDPAATERLPAGGDGRAGVLIGPEGGWTAEERDALVSLGATPVRLGERILRVETAAVAASALLLCGRSQS
jgi:16S rRNA (uracil1498-N3)-methyltransferase